VRQLLMVMMLGLSACATTPPPAEMETPAPVAPVAPAAVDSPAAPVPVSVPSPTVAQRPDPQMPKAPGALDGSGKIALLNTYWKLIAIEEVQIPLRPGYRESNLRLMSASDRFTGQGICGRVGGSYAIEGDKLDLVIIDGMPSACWPDGVPESTLIDAINDTVSFKIDGENLYLIDQDGLTRAHYLAQVRVGERGEPIERMN